MTQITLPHNHGESADELFSLLPAPQEFQTSAELFGLLSDESRLRIFWILCHSSKFGWKSTVSLLISASISMEILLRRASVYRIAAAPSPSTEPKFP